MLSSSIALIWLCSSACGLVEDVSVENEVCICGFRSEVVCEFVVVKISFISVSICVADRFMPDVESVVVLGIMSW